MYLKKNNSNGKPYLSFVQGYRKNGKVKHKTIEKLGYLENLEKIHNDPIEHFKKIAKERTIAKISEKALEISLANRLADNTSLRKNLGYAVAKSICSSLNLREFLNTKQQNLSIEYNLNNIFNLLIFNRFLFPSSKKSAFENKDIFFESFDFSLKDVYRSLDYLARYSTEIQSHIHEIVCRTVQRNNQLAYYDVTNYYFEIPYEDEDTFDKDGKLVKKGLRKKGPSKENRKDPIVQMGLLMDSKSLFSIFVKAGI